MRRRCWPQVRTVQDRHVLPVPTWIAHTKSPLSPLPLPDLAECGRLNTLKVLLEEVPEEVARDGGLKDILLRACS